MAYYNWANLGVHFNFDVPLSAVTYINREIRGASSATLVANYSPYLRRAGGDETSYYHDEAGYRASYGRYCDIQTGWSTAGNAFGQALYNQASFVQAIVFRWTPSQSTTRKALFSKRHDSANDNAVSFELSLDETTGILTFLTTTTGPNYNSLSLGSAISVNKWYIAYVAFDDSSKTKLIGVKEKGGSSWVTNSGVVTPSGSILYTSGGAALNDFIIGCGEVKTGGRAYIIQGHVQKYAMWKAYDTAANIQAAIENHFGRADDAATSGVSMARVVNA